VSRLRRLETTGKVFFVTCNLAHGVESLSPAERSLLLTVIDKARQRLRFRLFGYVVMPNHWHALVLPAPGRTIGSAMHAIKRNSALELNQRRATTGRVWQGRFFDRFVRKVKDFREALEYIHSNPVRDGFVHEPAAWSWSSYGHYSGCGKTQIRVDRIELPMDEKQRL